MYSQTPKNIIANIKVPLDAQLKSLEQHSRSFLLNCKCQKKLNLLHLIEGQRLLANNTVNNSFRSETFSTINKEIKSPSSKSNEMLTRILQVIQHDSTKNNADRFVQCR